MAYSAWKLFNHHDHHGPDHTHNSTTNCSKQKKKTRGQHEGHACGSKQKKKTQGQHEGHCMPKMLNHMKNLKKKKRTNRGISSSRDSESSSDNDITKKKK